MPGESTNKRFSRKKNLRDPANTAQPPEPEQDRGAKSPSVKAAEQAVENEQQALESGEESSA
jgi:hypothetical protein